MKWEVEGSRCRPSVRPPTKITTILIIQDELKLEECRVRLTQGSFFRFR